MTGPVFHLATPDEWAIATASGEITPASLTSEGFVHCSTEAQLSTTIERHFAGVDALVLLRFDADRLAPDLRWEESHPGESFPHVYRPIRVDEVLDAIPWRRGDDDRT